MKKMFCCVIGLVVLFSAMNVCYAGDVPESLLSDKQAQLYFGEIKGVDGDRITVIQRQNIKGDFTKDAEVTYEGFGITDAPEVGKQYLCGFLDENNPLYIWEVTGFDTNTLKIKNSDDMSQRLQTYLNNGDFAAKEQDRVPGADESKAPMDNQAPSNAPTTAENQMFPVVAWILGGCLVIGLVILIWKKR